MVQPTSLLSYLIPLTFVPVSLATQGSVSINLPSDTAVRMSDLPRTLPPYSTPNIDFSCDDVEFPDRDLKFVWYGPKVDDSSDSGRAWAQNVSLI